MRKIISWIFELRWLGTAHGASIAEPSRLALAVLPLAGVLVTIVFRHRALAVGLVSAISLAGVLAAKEECHACSLSDFVVVGTRRCRCAFSAARETKDPPIPGVALMQQRSDRTQNAKVP